MVKNKKSSNFKEKTMALKDAENLTVAEISEKSTNLASKNKVQESSLDKYIREHRSEIETAKKEQLEKATASANSLDSLIKSAREAGESDKSDELLSETNDNFHSQTPEAVDAASSSQPQDLSTAEVANDPDESNEEQEPTAAPTVQDEDNLADDSLSEISERTEPIVPENDTIDFPEVQGSFDQVILDSTSASSEQADAEQISEETEVDETNTSDVQGLAESDEPTSEVPLIVDNEPDEVKEPTPVVGVSPKLSNDTSESESKTSPKNHKKPVIIGLCALLLIGAGGGVAWTTHHDNVKQSSEAKASKAAESKAEEAKQTKVFNKKYAEFFVDDKQTKLKNDQFTKIDSLISEVDKLKTQSDYQELKTKVMALKTDITVTEAMNQNFDKPIIKDGSIEKTAKIKNNVKLSYTATENDSLNTLLKSAIAQGQAEQADKAKAEASKASSTSEDTSTKPASVPSTPATSTTETQASSTNSVGTGLTTAQYQANFPSVNLEVSRSRVPIDQNANLNDSAFAWSNGIKELVLQKCRERGYISGESYILLPASIQKGNGYYNLYKPDGTYLVSINAKTGYFVGNASGHSDNLDY